MKLAAVMLCLAALTRAQTGRVPSALERGLQAYSRGDFAEAEALLRTAAGREPDSFDVRFLLGASLVQLGRRDEAIRELRDAVRLNPAHADARKLLASQYMIQREYAEAVALLKKANKLDEEMHLLLIEAYHTSGDTAASFALARQAVTRFPRSPRVNCWIGFQLQSSGRYEDAKRYLENARRIAPEYAATYYLLGDVLLKQQDYTAAILHFRTAIEKDPEDVDARLGLAQALVALDEPAKALEVLQEAARAAPRDSRVHFQLSRLHYRLGDERSADREAEISLTLRNSETPATDAPSVLKRR
jgi:tetratricopeptide (TPR) repeat protein